MSEDTPVNTGVSWPPEHEAGLLVRRMQVKLHHWAAADRCRRFHDLFNLVSDPAFLTVAWQRVSTNAGARTPGVDRATVSLHRRPGRSTRVPGPHSGPAEVGAVPAGRGAAGDDSQGVRQAAEAGHPDRHRPGGAGGIETCS